MDPIDRQEAMYAHCMIVCEKEPDACAIDCPDEAIFRQLPSAQPEITKEYNLKKIYNIYVKIAQAHFVYQPSKPKAITAMPFDWIETQNLLEKYLEDHGADFDALCREYVSENVKDDHLPSAQPEIKPIGYRDCANAMLRMWMDKVITDGEYNRIMDKLNAHWKR